MLETYRTPEPPRWQWPFGDAFMRHAENGLVWLAEKGYGYLCVREAPYDADYFKKYEGYAATEQGRAITQARCQLVERWMGGPPMRTQASIIDVGIGCGDFITAMRARGHQGIRGADINPAGIEWLEARELRADPYKDHADAFTFWDVLEHIPDAAKLLARVNWVFTSLPIFTGPEHVLKSKHFRRDEHCWYFTRAGLIEWMAEQGFICVEHGSPESLLGREDIETFAFRRVR